MELNDFTFNFTAWDGTDIQVYSGDHTTPANTLKVVNEGGSIEFFDPYVRDSHVHIVASILTPKANIVCLYTLTDLFSSLEPTFVASRLKYYFSGFWTAARLVGPSIPLNSISDPRYRKMFYLKEMPLAEFCEEMLS